MSTDAMEERIRVRRQRWVEGVVRLGRHAQSQIATPTTLVAGVGAGFILERAGRHPMPVLRLFQDLKKTWVSLTRAADR